MGTFTASLRAIGDVKSLPAVVELSDGQLRIAAGDTEIGSWSLDEIHLEEIPTGYRMAAEGEQILIELKDPLAFAAELNNGSRKRARLGRKKQPMPRPEPTPVSAVREEPAPSPAPARVEGQPSSVTLPPREDKAPRPSGLKERGLSFVDTTLAKANKKLGPYLPDWVFTRAMFGIAFGALLLMILFPGLVSAFLLVAGALMVVFGAIVYSDQMLASRWLPGRTTPQHALLFGVAILMMGVLLGVVAS